MSELADRMASARKKAGKSQKQVAEAIGVSVQAVSQWETGKTEPTFARLNALADLLNVNVSWFLNGFDAQDVSNRAVEKLIRDANLGELDYIDRIPIITIDESVWFSTFIATKNEFDHYPSISPTNPLFGKGFRHCF